jgi:phospholipid/cholesterol/gamma-HCH transport system permease protein
MKVTEQIDALRLLSIDPVEFLTLPRWIACVFAAVSLSVCSIAIAVLGGASIASFSLGYTIGQYFNTMFVFTRYSDWGCCLIKAAVFGTIIPIVASHHGFRCRHGSQGVGEASTNAVVQGSMMIIVADFVLTYLLYAV